MNLKKIKNYFNWPLTTKEIIKLLQEHMIRVCGRCEDVNPYDLYLVKLKSSFSGPDFVVVYKWNDLYWEIDFKRDVGAFSLRLAYKRYEYTNMEQFSILHWLYVMPRKHEMIYVFVKGKKVSNLRLKRTVKKK